MKITNKVLIILAFCITFSACNTTKKVKVEDFTVDMNSPQVTVGEVELQLETLMGMGKLKKQNVTVHYFPREDAICLKYKFEFYTYNQFWDKKGRANFIYALQKYNEDYAARDLQQKSSKTLFKYGIIRGYLVWQQFSFTVQARANMNVELGYTFKDRSPYFTIYQRDADYIDEYARDSNRTSPNIIMYFTRAQAAELSAIFEQYMIPDEDVEASTPGKNKPFSDLLDAFSPQKREDASKDEY